MAITDAQQAKQIMMKKGGPVHRHQLAKKRKDGWKDRYIYFFKFYLRYRFNNFSLITSFHFPKGFCR